jgi:hypothetical protein
MAAKVDGRQKMAIAKDVVRTTFTKSIPANAHLAVQAYGHRRKEGFFAGPPEKADSPGFSGKISSH